MSKTQRKKYNIGGFTGMPTTFYNTPNTVPPKNTFQEQITPSVAKAAPQSSFMEKMPALGGNASVPQPMKAGGVVNKGKKVNIFEKRRADIAKAEEKAMKGESKKKEAEPDNKAFFKKREGKSKTPPKEMLEKHYKTTKGVDMAKGGAVKKKYNVGGMAPQQREVVGSQKPAAPNQMAMQRAAVGNTGMASGVAAPQARQQMMAKGGMVKKPAKKAAKKKA